MTDLLITVGVFVFMMTVYGTVVIGGHLLKQLADGQTGVAATAPAIPATQSSDPTPVPESREPVGL
jgi:hypothetical protein